MFNSRPGEDLVSHLLLTGELAGHYGKEFKNEITARTRGLLHDTGKATDKFQRLLNKDLTLVDHAEVSAQVLFSLFERCRIKFDDERLLYKKTFETDFVRAHEKIVISMPSGKIDPEYQSAIFD